MEIKAHEEKIEVEQGRLAEAVRKAYRNGLERGKKASCWRWKDILIFLAGFILGVILF